MSVNERISIVRSRVGLTTRAFGAKLNVTGGTITNLEKGNRNVTDRIISDICREFNVNETWLRLGEGEIFKKDINEEIERLAEKYHLNDLAKNVVHAFVNLKEDEMNAVLSFIQKVSESSLKEANNEVSQELTDDEIEQEVQNYRNELHHEKKIKTSLALQERSVKAM